MKWKKLGLIYNANKENESLYSHATIACAEHIQGDEFRLYFASRDKDNRGYTNSIDINIKKPNKYYNLSKKPHLSPGDLGTFDDSGAGATWLVKCGELRYIYYVGWNLGVTVPFRNSIGLYISKDGLPFKQYAKGPILDRTINEPYFCASCAVLVEGNLWRMWYLNCTEWFKDINDNITHKYHLKYAESEDGIHWKRDGVVAIDYDTEYEYAISKPCVIKDGDIYKMWFSSRATKDIPTYRIRYAESKDGINWVRINSPKDVGIDVSSSGWDSEMICYPYVFDHDGKRYMLYNGNGYGKSGFGLAVLEEE